MDIAMPLRLADGQESTMDVPGSWADCILPLGEESGFRRPSADADPKLSALLSAASYPVPTPSNRQRPTPTWPDSMSTAFYGGLYVEAPGETMRPGHEAAFHVADSTRRSTGDVLTTSSTSRWRGKGPSPGAAKRHRKGASEKQVGRPRKPVDLSDCDDPEERRRRQIRLAQRTYRLRKESRVSLLATRVTELESSVDKMGAAIISLGTRLVQSGALVPHPDLGICLGETMQTCQRLLRESNGQNEDRDMEIQYSGGQGTASDPVLQLPSEPYTPPIPPVDLSLLGLGNGNPTPKDGRGGAAIITHAEFMERLHSAIIFCAYSVLADPSTPVERISKQFRLTLAVMDRRRMLGYFAASLQAKLSRSRLGREWSDVPFFQLGGAGTHYFWSSEKQRAEQIHNGQQGMDNDTAFLPSPSSSPSYSASPPYSERSITWPHVPVSSSVFPVDVWQEVDGDWFDMQDLELYLRERDTTLFSENAGGPRGYSATAQSSLNGFVNAEWLIRRRHVWAVRRAFGGET